jgi:hypothetical protein
MPNATDELHTFPGEDMKTVRLMTTAVMMILTAACATERMAAPERAAQPAAVAGTAALLPLLYVVDGVRLPRDVVPALTASQVASVEVIKGRTALKRFGADASYGVVLITTKQAASAQ